MENDKLSDEEKVRLGLTAERVLEMMARQHGVSMAQIAEAVRYVERDRAYRDALRKAGALSLIGFLVSALLLTLWEGFKAFVRRGG